MNTRILVAADGSADSVGALHTAQWLSTAGGRDVTVLTVLEPAGVYDAGFAAPPLWREELRNHQAEALRRVVLDQLRALGAKIPESSVRVETGSPGRTIVRTAHRTGAGLIVLGIGQHAAMDRWAGREVALQVARLAHVPVLAVPRDVSSLPRRVVVGVDFSSFGRDALRALPAVIPPDAEVHLAHVIHPPTTDPESWLRLYAAYAPRARQAIEDLATELELAHGIHSTVRVLEGPPARSLLEFAEELGADLIATGSHGRGFWSRLVLGSVTTRVLRGSAGAVLVVPPPESPAELLSEPTPADALALS